MKRLAMVGVVGLLGLSALGACGDDDDTADDVSVSSILADADAQATTVQASIATLNTAICTAGGPTTATG